MMLTKKSNTAEMMSSAMTCMLLVHSLLPSLYLEISTLFFIKKKAGNCQHNIDNSLPSLALSLLAVEDVEVIEDKQRTAASCF